MADQRRPVKDKVMAAQLRFLAAVVTALSLGLFLSGEASAQTYVVRDGSAKSVIVLQDGAQGLYRHAAEELQKYIGQLTGVRPDIVIPGEVSGRPKDEVLLIVGGPEANALTKQATQAGKISFSNLKPEGFLLKTIKIGERPALVIGGNDEAGTLYGAYDWLERQGIVFQITNDIIPQTKTSLVLNDLDIRSEPAFVQRGFGIASCYETRSIWSYADIVKFIDQMAKMKLNYLIWHMFSSEPYLEESFEGEKKLMGDEASWEGGYTLPAYDFGSHKVQDYFVGKEAFEKFGKKYMAPDEWQGVSDQDRVYSTARALLQRVIRYAKTRNIKVWVALESLDELAPNLARYTRRPDVQLPYSPFHGAYACPTDENLYKINEIRFKTLLQSYPEAAGFIFWVNEGYPVCHDADDQELIKNERSKYAGVSELIGQHYEAVARFQSTDSAVANSIGSVHLVQKILEVRDRVSPNTKIGIGLWGRAYLLPTLDKVLPKDVLIVDNETSGVWTPSGVPMQLYGGMGDRDRIFMHVGDDDTGMIGMQYHVRLYYRDRMLEGALENGVEV